MKTRRQLTEDLAHKDALWQEEMATSRQLRGDLEYEKTRLAAATARCQEISNQLSEVVHSRSLEIRTEALRQAHNSRGDLDLRLAYLYEQYLAKGVTLPTETPNLTTAVHLASQAIAGLCEALDDTHAGRLNTIIEALQWAGRVSQESIELAAEKQKLIEINSEIGHNLQSKLKENAALKREVHDQANEIEEKTARLKSYEDPYSRVNQTSTAWEAIIDHPALKAAFGRDGSLVDGVMDRLDELYSLEKDSATEAVTTEVMESSASRVARAERSDRELRLISAQLRPHSPQAVLDFINEAMTPEDQELRIRAIQLAQGQVGYAEKLFSFLSDPEGYVAGVKGDPGE